MKTYDVTVKRTVEQSATIRVAAKGKRDAALHADLSKAEWRDGGGSGAISVKAIEEVAGELSLPAAKRGGQKAA